MSQRRLGKAGPDCFASKVDTKILDGCQGCGSCGYVATKPSFSEGDEVTCWAPAHERVRRLPSLLWYSPEYPYTCGNSDCYKIHDRREASRAQRLANYLVRHRPLPVPD